MARPKPSTEFTLEDSKLRYHQSAAKTLIYQDDPDTNPNLAQNKKRGRRGMQVPGSNPVDQNSLPYAVQAISVQDKYEGHGNFHLRKANRQVIDKIGGSQPGGDGFDPKLYANNLVDLHRSKVESNYKNYRGCGNILTHAGSSRPGSRQPPANGTPGESELENEEPMSGAATPPPPMAAIPKPAHMPASSVPWAIDD